MMSTKQQTIKNVVVLSGVGLHTGIHVNLKFMPAPINHGIQFQRIDIPQSKPIAAIADYVIDVKRSTSLAKEDVYIHTVEHILAAVAGLEIDNLLIQMDAPEVPIMDGSALPFVKALQKAMIVNQEADRIFLEVTEEIFYRDKENNIEISALPLESYRLAVMVDYNSSVLGSQHISLNNLQHFEKEIAPCRTFCFLHELEKLYDQNLIKGGDVNNAIVIVDQPVDDKKIEKLSKIFKKRPVHIQYGKILNDQPLYHKNEPARHKLLDLIGDLVLVGVPLKAQILAARPGHAANVALAKKLRKYMLEKQQNVPKYDLEKPSLLDIKKITHMLPHRYPFQLVDKIIALDKKNITGVKNVTINEPFFQGHFPQNPVMPGVLQVEALAQTGGILVLTTVDDPQNYWTYFVAIDNCRFKKMVIPGDTLLLQCELMASIKRGFAKMTGRAFVGKELVCEVMMSAKIVKKTV